MREKAGGLPCEHGWMDDERDRPDEGALDERERLLDRREERIEQRERVADQHDKTSSRREIDAEDIYPPMVD
jgi:hypothetical protein